MMFQDYDHEKAVELLSKVLQTRIEHHGRAPTLLNGPLTCFAAQ